MNEAEKPLQPTPSPRRRSLRFVAAALVVLVIGAAALLYVTMGGRGKETVEASACATTPAQRAEIDRAAKGEVAALAIAKAPKPVTPIAFSAPDGATTSLEAFKGKVVLLNLWATWCVPCRREMPALDRLEAKLGGKDFAIVAVNIDTARPERPKAFLNEVGVKALPYYSDAKADVFYKLKQAGKVVGLPTTILVDRAGCEIGTMAGPAEWDSPDGVALIETAVKS
jgi:thiol-disulfide isomerase/thioredoxin